jgi:hypothetical protein
MRQLRVTRRIELVTTICKKCELTFRYWRKGKKRKYCEPCVELRRQEMNDFHNAKAKEARRVARANAIACHEVTA